MQIPPSTALTETQIDQLEDALDSLEGAMDIEEVDGFFCALISGPDSVMPSEYLTHVFGGEMPEFGSVEDTSKIMGLLLQHWNHIAATLLRDELYFPLLFEDETGKCQANNWAHGYMLGVQLRRESWSDLIENEVNGGLILPLLALYLEDDDDPEFGPIDDHRREGILAGMIASIRGIYRYFAAERTQGMQQPIQDQPPKIGSDDPCYCGSGKKYKHCHGAATLH